MTAREPRATPATGGGSTAAWGLVSLCGSLLLAVPAGRYRLDTVSCPTRPDPLHGIAYGAVYLVAVGLLTAAWIGLSRALVKAPASTPRVLGWGALVHGAALVAPPFLSRDPLCYAAVGRMMAAFHHGPQEILARGLPPGDPFLTVLPPAWQAGNSAYSAGFNFIAATVARIGGDDLGLHLRLYQVIGLISMLLASWLVGLAARPPVGESPVEPARLSPAAATATVLFCPLAVIDGTQSAHNDSLLALGMALFVLLAQRRRSAGAFGALVAGLLIKATALLPLGVHCLQLALGRLRWRWLRRPAPVVGAALVASVALLGTILYLRARHPWLHTYTALLGTPDVPYDKCTRSVECLPRVLLRFVFHAPMAAWLVGLAFRVAAALLLLYAALRAARDGRSLEWMGFGLFLYYLFLHGWSQSWYLLPLLPLLPFASPRVAAGLKVFLVSSVAYYALVIPLDCITSELGLALGDLVEAIVEIIPPTVVLWRLGNQRAGQATE